jgi:prepilin-type N-terminal cleavage/methylation domain-containing protein
MNRRPFEDRRGVTLIELIMTIVILSVILAITTLSLAGKPRAKVAIASVSAQVIALRAAAVTTGIPQTGALTDSTGIRLGTALPDGRVISDESGLDRSTGLVRNSNAR